MDIIPDCIIGDLDSITKQTLSYYQKKTKIINDPDQYKTDLELAIQRAIQNDAEEIIIHCGIGKRLDHTLANLLTLSQIPSNIKGKIIAENTTVSLIQNKTTIEKKNEETISIIPLEAIEGLTYHGMKWDVTDLTTKAGWFGISNKVKEKQATLHLSKGSFLLIKIKD